MTTRRRPIDELPLYATEAEIAHAILGSRASEWKQICVLYERRGLPKINALLGGRYVPAVKRFFDILEGVEASSQIPVRDGPERNTWNDRKTRKAPTALRVSNGGLEKTG